MQKLLDFIEGNLYSFKIEADNGMFKILAIHKETRRCSSICNLNAMLGELGVKYESPRFEDSCWEVTPEGARRLFLRAVDSLSTSTFRAYMEKRLDEDRYADEWENLISESFN